MPAWCSSKTCSPAAMPVRIRERCASSVVCAQAASITILKTSVIPRGIIPFSRCSVIFRSAITSSVTRFITPGRYYRTCTGCRQQNCGWRSLTTTMGRRPSGAPATRSARSGDHKAARYSSDNCRQMAETGPCGPCSESFYDHGPHVPGGPPGSPDADGDRYIEIWNLVFMQYNRSADGALTPLPKPCVDTGMGLARIAAVLQHVQSSYDIDLFRALIRAATRATGRTAAPPRKPLEHFSVRLPLARARRQYGDRCGRSRSPSRSDGGDRAGSANTQSGEATQGKPMKNALETALKVIADHIRACAFLITDGVIPSNEGRGYVLRRIIRRAIRHGYQLGCKTPCFHALVVDLAREMGSAYPELAAAQRRTTDILHQEEARFFETIVSGMAMLEAELSSIAPRVHARSDMVSPLLSGELAFKLHDTYGFPLDLTADICRARGVGVHEAAFNAAMARQKERARSAGKFNPEQ